MGVAGDNVGPEVRAQAARQIGQQFKDVGDKLGTVDTKKLYRDLQQIAEEEATQGLPTSAAWRVLKRFEKGRTGREAAVAGAGPDLMAGGQLVAMRSQVAKEMRDAFANNRSDVGEVLGQTLEAVDDAISKAARAAGDEGLVQTYGQAREAWTVLRAMDRGGASMDGNVLPGQAARIIKGSDKRGLWGGAGDAEGVQASSLRGGGPVPGADPLGEFYDALRFKASQIGKPIVGDSGTATRSAVGQWLQGGSTMGSLANAAGGAARGLATRPIISAYANMSDEAAQRALQIYAAMQAQETGRSGAIGAGLARGLFGQ
jgi:hypothetical protein